MTLFALITPGLDPAGNAVQLVRELFPAQPTLAPGLIVRDVSTVTTIQVGMIANTDGTYVFYVPPAPTPAQLQAYAANVRFVKETAGIIVNGVAVATDRGSQALINGAYNFVTINPSATVNFKGSAGFVQLNATQVTAIAVAVATHVQACFAEEAVLDTGIAAGTINSTAQIDAGFAAITV
jgi:hypothetical protein